MGKTSKRFELERIRISCTHPNNGYYEKWQTSKRFEGGEKMCTETRPSSDSEAATLNPLEHS
jgi:hypothetical protein